MEYFILIGIFLLLVYLGQCKVVATGIVTAGNGKVETKIFYDKSNKKTLYAMALCYAAKIKWVILSEPEWVQKSFINIFKNTLNSWPEVPYVEMRSSLDNLPSTYKIKIYHTRNWSINNDFPKKSYSGDLVTNYFFLLKAVVNELNNEEKKKLGDLLRYTKDDILSIQDKSVFALTSVIRKISNILNKEN